jgi:hypothetical protein
MKWAYGVFAVLLTMALLLAAILHGTVSGARSDPPNSPPFIKARIPEFTVYEGSVNNTMKDIDLFEVFGDPDLPPAGNDSLNFSVDASEFPATITDNKLNFGVAPSFAGKENHTVTVMVTATDKDGLSVSLVVNITIINLNRAPDFFWTNIEILENAVSYFDLHTMFIDPDGDSLNFTYLGGASDNLTVEVAPNGSAVLRPADGYTTAQAVLRFKATDPLGANRTGELVVRILAAYHPIPRPAQIPEPEEQINVNEGDNITFEVFWLDWIGQRSNSPNLTYDWSIDYFLKASSGSDNFTWKTGFNDAGPHQATCRISDGRSYVVASWNLTVLYISHPPIIMGLWPPNNTKFQYNTKITFRATATDTDGGPLTFYWRLSDGTLLKTSTGTNSSAFSKYFSGGKQYIVVLEVHDSFGGATRAYLYIKVAPKPVTGSTAIPAWLDVLIIAGPAALVATALMLWTWKRP